MHKIIIFSLLISITIFNSCQFNQSVNTDLVTGAYSRGNGIGSNNVIIEINEKAENRNEFIFGEKVNLIFNNITGLTNVDGKTYPGISMHIVKNEKDTILSNKNLLKNLNDGTDLYPLQLQANFTAIMSSQTNEKYKAYIEIWDKKGDGKFNYELPFTINKNNLLDIKNNGIKYSSIYLWDETLKQPVLENNVNSEHLYILILDHIKGLELNSGKVFPVFSIDITDNNGNKVISNPNLLSAYEKEGVDPENLKTQLTVKITFPREKINNPYKLKVKLKDNNSSKEINITTKLRIN